MNVHHNPFVLSDKACIFAIGTRKKQRQLHFVFLKRKCSCERSVCVQITDSYPAGYYQKIRNSLSG